jgi:hypothetical protein
MQCSYRINLVNRYNRSYKNLCFIIVSSRVDTKVNFFTSRNTGTKLIRNKNVFREISQMLRNVADSFGEVYRRKIFNILYIFQVRMQIISVVRFDLEHDPDPVHYVDLFSPSP